MAINPNLLRLLTLGLLLGTINDSLAEQDSSATGIQSFLTSHWQRVLQPQGSPDPNLPEQEQSLAPEDCAGCHPLQFQDWQTSMHSRSMGPGVMGQILVMQNTDPATAELCQNCHAPLAEQRRSLFSEQLGWQENPLFDSGLQSHGMFCSACHVRGNTKYGPPRMGRPQELGQIDEDLPHNGFVASEAFLSSKFCSVCHQFEPGDLALNGKLIENTYAEWQASRYPSEGIQCQNCHMPGRRHLWQGIHDPDMVRQGLTIDSQLVTEPLRVGETVVLSINLINSGTGHYFPTYLTPKVFVSAWLSNAEGDRIEASFQQYVIGRESYDLMTEAYDTRLAPDEQISIGYEYPVPVRAAHLHVQILVDPDHWYRRFYENYLASMSGTGTDNTEMALMQEAWNKSASSSFVIYEQDIALLQ